MLFAVGHRSLSPSRHEVLTQFEHSPQVRCACLIREFAALGYDSYRLVPGLNLLIPFDPGSQPDTYLLNLFCCKSARADRLAARGLCCVLPMSPGRGPRWE
jgi:hypothetical protein